MPNTGSDGRKAITRREFLRRGTALGAAFLAPAWLPKIVFGANQSPERDVLLVVFLRGGADGLNLCPPFGEPAYYKNRPTLSLPPPDSKDPRRIENLDGFFGLARPLAPLLEIFRAGEMAVVHAAGSTDPTRSHFDAQRNMEAGFANVETKRSGWLGRHLSRLGAMQPGTPMRGVATTIGLPLSFAGAADVVAVPDPVRYKLGETAASRAERAAYVGEMYRRNGGGLAAPAQNVFDTLDRMAGIDVGGYVPAHAAVYPEEPFARSLRAAAALIKADVGVEVIQAEISNWDSHANQGTDIGQVAKNMRALAEGLAAFHKDVMQDGRRVMVVVLSEFGRALKENASAGTDHGRGGVMFVIGRNIAGGKVHGVWPGLEKENLFEGVDLAVTTDYRDVLAEIVAKRLRGSDLSALFPGHAPKFPGLIL